MMIGQLQTVRHECDRVNGHEARRWHAWLCACCTWHAATFASYHFFITRNLWLHKFRNFPYTIFAWILNFRQQNYYTGVLSVGQLWTVCALSFAICNFFDTKIMICQLPTVREKFHSVRASRSQTVRTTLHHEPSALTTDIHYMWYRLSLTEWSS